MLSTSVSIRPTESEYRMRNTLHKSCTIPRKSRLSYYNNMVTVFRHIAFN